MRLMVLGAHPDDPDSSAGGLAARCVQDGGEALLVSVTNGNAGHHRMAPEELARRRASEARAAGEAIGADYVVLDHDDGRLTPSLQVREELIRLMREFSPDLLLGPRPSDYHADHRAVGQLMMDASYLLTVPLVCPGTAIMSRMPVIAYTYDRFTTPRPFRADGVVAVGGAQGTAMATAAMQELPVGIPKVMVSTVACGQTPFGPYVGTKDVTMIHSVGDILGLNRITGRILAQAAAAVVSMASVTPPEVKKGATVAITQAGVTTPGVMAVKSILEQEGFQVIAFHCNGIGGQAMEELVLGGQIQGVIDFSPHEIADLLFDGLMPAHPDRMKAAGRAGIPQVVAPGCTDIQVQGVLEDLPDEFRQRACVKHSPTYTHVRSSPEEMAAIGAFIAQRLNAGGGPRAAIVPLRGFSMLNREGKVLYDEAANQAYVAGLKKALASDVRLVKVDAHINDPTFAAATAALFLELQGQGDDHGRETG